MHQALGLCLSLLAALTLAACNNRTNVSATGNVPAQYTHVYLTISQVWFNASATASPADSGWSTFTLSTPQTIDLVALTNGGLSQFASQLKVGAGSWSQMLLVLADTGATLATSAASLGAASNNEVDYYDTSGVLHQTPLQVVNVAAGVVVPIALTISVDLNPGGSAATSSSAADSSTTSTSTTSTSGTTTSAIVYFDATRDLRPISLSGTAAFALDPHPQGFDAGKAGTVAGSVDLSGVDTLSVSGVPDVQVAAETLSSDGTRHVVAATTLVAADGSFSLYPLSTAPGAPTSYDIVIHGPDIDTVIVKSVPVASGAPGTATVELGAIALTSATAFAVNVNSSQPISPTTATVGFYQTLPLSAEVPYLVEQRAPDPFSGVFSEAQELSGGALQYATFASAGTAITPGTATPVEGASTYRVAAINPLYGEGALDTTVAAASSGGTALFTASALSLPTGSTPDSIAGTLAVTNPGTYDKGELLLTQGGALVATVPLDGYLSQASSALTFTTSITGSSSSSSADVYYAEVWAWNSSNPAGTLVRTPYGSPIDLSGGSVGGIALSIQ